MLVFPLLRTQSQEAVVKFTALSQALNQGHGANLRDTLITLLPFSPSLLLRQGTLDKSLLETRQVCAATAEDLSAAMAGRGTAKASVRVKRTSLSVFGSNCKYKIG